MVDNPAHSLTADSLVAVTGATGHVGNVLVRQLLARGARVRALVPHGEDITPLRDMQVELVTADVRDFDSLMKGIAGADLVFHLGGIITISTGLRSTLWEVNVEGAKNNASAARMQLAGWALWSTRVRFARLRRTSPTASASPRTNAPWIPRESSAITPPHPRPPPPWPCARRQPAVWTWWSVHPSGIIGPYDYKLFRDGTTGAGSGARHPVGVRGRRRHLTSWMCGTWRSRPSLAAAQYGRSGEGYILSGQRHPRSGVLLPGRGDDRGQTALHSHPRRTGSSRGPPRSLLLPLAGKKPPLFYQLLHGGVALQLRHAATQSRTRTGIPAASPRRIGIEDTVRWFRRAGKI